MTDHGRLLLVSSSKSKGGDYLDHCIDAMREMLGGVDELLFVPYALHDRDAYAAVARDRFGRVGVSVRSIHNAPDPVAAVEGASAIFIGGGNTFRLLTSLYERSLIEPIRSRIRAGAIYMGTSAGSNVACPTIQTTNDMPIVQPPSFDALSLVPFNINPHYVERDPDAPHHGETRRQRIAEFHEMNHRTVIGLPEGSMLRIIDGRVDVLGDAAALVFRRAREPEPVAPGARVDWLAADSDQEPGSPADH